MSQPPHPYAPPPSPYAPTPPRSAAPGAMWALAAVLTVMAAAAFVLAVGSSGASTASMCSLSDVTLGECLLAGRVNRAVTRLEFGLSVVFGCGAVAAAASAYLRGRRPTR